MKRWSSEDQGPQPAPAPPARYLQTQLLVPRRTSVNQHVTSDPCGVVGQQTPVQVYDTLPTLVYRWPRERMGPRGLRGLQIRWQQPSAASAGGRLPLTPATLFNNRVGVPGHLSFCARFKTIPLERAIVASHEALVPAEFAYIRSDVLPSRLTPLTVNIR